MYKKIIPLIIFMLFPLVWAQENEQNQLVIDNIICNGNLTTNCDLIKREFYLSSGDILNEDEIQNAKIRLKLKNLFESVNISLKKGSLKYHVDVVVDVIEKSSTFIETSIHSSVFDTGSNETAGVIFGDRNLFGNGKSLIGNLSYSSVFDSGSSQASGGISYIDPNLLGSKRYFLNASISHTKYPMSSSNNDTFSLNNATTYAFGFGRRIFDFSYLLITSSVSEVSWESKSEFGNTSNKEFYRNMLLTYGWNTEDDSYFATSGDKFSLNYSNTIYQYQSENSYSYYSTYQKNFALTEKHSLTGNVQINLMGNGQKSDTILYKQYQLGIQYNYQIANNFNNKEALIQRGRLYYKLSPYSYQSEDYSIDSNKQHEVGFLFDSKILGIVKLSLSHWSTL